MAVFKLCEPTFWFFKNTNRVQFWAFTPQFAGLTREIAQEMAQDRAYVK
jgi:hypothetical protein